MCGITGIQVFSADLRERLESVRASTAKLKQRGPDDEGIYMQDLTALGHRRLSVIDTSKAGAQPFTDPSGRYTIILNGEFFNYREHRKNLQAKGIAFRSESDTEVLLQLWILEKEKCIPKINGFFAFAVYDIKEKSLHVVRDRYGVKPLLYSLDADQIVFASELKALLEYGIPRDLDFVSLKTYLQLNYIPSPHSIFKSVKKLEPGHYLHVAGSVCTIHKYYEIPTEECQPLPDYEQAKKKIRELVDDSIQTRMVADVPLGAFLSGGVDSSIVAAIASQNNSLLKTFSIGFPDEPYFDETAYAEQIAKKFKTDHTVFALRNAELFENLHGMLDYLDEPFADSSALLVYILSKRTRKQVTVALTGDGADELFSGYNKHAAEYRIRHKGLAELAVYAGRGVWEALPKSRNTSFSNRVRQFQKFSEGMRQDDADRYWSWAGFAREDQVNDLLIASNEQTIFQERKSEILKELDTGFNSVLKTDFKLVLQNDMLVKTDMMSMANGLELRNPFLDYRLVNYVFSLPEEYKINRNTRKRILKDAYADLLPPEILSRKKQGFEVPLLNWFRTDLKTMIFDELLSDSFLENQGIFRISEVNKLKEKIVSANPGEAVARIWALVVFQFWWRKYASPE
jgi:asparagine synthase (glutamine-hydrolysing)